MYLHEQSSNNEFLRPIRKQWLFAIARTYLDGNVAAIALYEHAQFSIPGIDFTEAAADTDLFSESRSRDMAVVRQGSRDFLIENRMTNMLVGESNGCNNAQHVPFLRKQSTEKKNLAVNRRFLPIPGPSSPRRNRARESRTAYPRRDGEQHGLAL